MFIFVQEKRNVISDFKKKGIWMPRVTYRLITRKPLHILKYFKHLPNSTLFKGKVEQLSARAITWAGHWGL